MKTVSSLIVIVFAALSGCASTNQARTDQGSLYDTILEREHQWAKSMREHDIAALETILAKEFRLTFSDIADFPEERPPATSREYWLNNLPRMQFGPITISDAKVTRMGERFAVIQMKMKLENWRMGDRLLGSEYELVDVWVFRDGRWQAKSRASHSISDEER